MKSALRLAALLFITLSSAIPALAQSTLLQGGTFGAGRAPMYVNTGQFGVTQPVVQDSGPAAGGGPGLGLSELNVTARGTGTPPYNAQGSGPLGTIGCFNDAPANNPTGYHYFCFSPLAGSGGLIAYGAAGGAAQDPLVFNINGQAYQFPFAVGGIVGPSTSVVNDAACWNNTVGTLLKDCGAFVTGPATTVANDAACWNNLVGTLLKDCGALVTVGGTNLWTGSNSWSGTSNFTGPFQINSIAQTFPASGSIVGTSDMQSLTNKSINAGEVNSGTLAAAQMPALTGAVASAAGSTATTLQSSVAGWGIAVGGGLASIATAQPPYGYDVPINLGLTAAVSGNALTINLTGANGSAPSATNPVSVPFRSTTLATGTPNWTAITSALSVTVPSGATLGTSNTVPFRVWVFLEYNAGVPELVVATCSAANVISPCASWETIQKTTTTMSSGSDSTGTPYATTGVSSDTMRIIGYAEYGSGLTTAGTWASAPTTLQLMGPGVKKPGDIVQTIPNFTTTVGSTASASFVALASGQAQAIVLSSSMNIVRADLRGSMINSAITVIGQIILARGTTVLTSTCSVASTAQAGASSQSPASLLCYDSPGTTNSTTYNVYGKIQSGDTLSYPVSGSTSILELQEIMGALVPANDDAPARMTG